MVAVGVLVVGVGSFWCHGGEMFALVMNFIEVMLTSPPGPLWGEGGGEPNGPTLRNTGLLFTEEK